MSAYGPKRTLGVRYFPELTLLGSSYIIIDMSLRPCKECGVQVSNKADNCPHCGAPVKKKSPRMGCGSLILIVIFGLFLIIFLQPDTDTYRSPNKVRSTPTPSASAPSTADPEFVRQVQRSLGAVGYDAGPADGVFGVRTTEAIRQFQADNGMAVSGKPDAQFVSRLADAREASLNVPSSSATNKAHSILVKMAESERARNLGLVVDGGENSCIGASKSYFQGFDENNAAYWNITCSDGARYGVQIAADSGGSSRVMECSLLAYLDIECYKRLD